MYDFSSLDGKEKVGSIIPPNSYQAEQAVLGSLMIDNDCYQKIAAITKPEHFYRPNHKEIFFAVRMKLAMYGVADIVTLSNHLKSEGKLEKIGGIPYLNLLYENTPTSANVKAYAEILLEKYESRALLEVSQKVFNLINDDPVNGRKQAQKEIERIANKTPTSNKKLFTPLGELLKNRTCVNWLIRDYLPTKSTCMIYGESGAGKSFLMLDMALCIATGRHWNGIKTKQTPVFYIIGEGQEGATSRCYVWGQYHNQQIDNIPFYLTEKAVIPTDEDELNALIANVSALIESTEAEKPLIVFDTLARCFDGDENKAQDANRYIRAMDKLRYRFDACVVSIHHSGKDVAKGARGSTAFKGAWDAEHQLSIDANKVIKLHPQKLKEREKPEPTYYRLHGMETNWLDEDGEIVRSAVILPEFDVIQPEPEQRKPTLKPTTQSILSALRTAINEKGVSTPSHLISGLFTHEPQKAPAKVVTLDDFRDYAYPFLKGTNKRRDLASELDKLEKAGESMYWGEYLWLC